MRRIAVKGVIGLIAVVTLAVAGGYVFLLRSLPTIAGTIEVPGLSGAGTEAQREAATRTDAIA